MPPTVSDSEAAKRSVSATGSGTGRARRVGLLIFSNGWGGMEIHAATLARLLAARGHEVVIAELGDSFFARRGEFDASRGVRVESADLWRPIRRAGFLRSWRYLRGLRPDVVVLVKGWTAVGGLSLDLAARLACPRFMTIEQLAPPPRPAFQRGRHVGGLVPGLGLWWFRHQVSVYARSVGPRRIVGVSRAVTRELAAYGFPVRKLVTVPNGIDAERYRRSPADRETVRAAWGVPADALLFGTVGRLARPHKGQDIALILLARFRQRLPGCAFRYVLVGDGPDRAALEAQAVELGLAGHVIFAGHTERAWEVYSAIDALLMPSRIEGTPFALLEAMACECCPIAMGVAGIPDVIVDPGIGWVISPGDQEGFLAAMEAAARAGEAERRAMGQRAREQIARHFRADENFARLADLIEEL